MFFVNGQDFNTVLVLPDGKYLLRARLRAVPAPGNHLVYYGQRYRIKRVTHFYSNRPCRGKKLTLYFDCDVCP